MYLHTDKLSMGDLERIAASVDVRLYNEREEGHDRQGRVKFRLVLRPAYAAGDERDRFRLVKNGGRRAWAICWHGHYAFMEAVFERDPDARLVSALADYRGRDDFYAQAGGTGTRNVGSMMEPLPYAGACTCVQSAPANNGASVEIMGAFLDRVRGEFDANALNAAHG